MRQYKRHGYGHYKKWHDQKKCGYRKNLYRNKHDGKIAGVCAGLADHIGVDHWVIRIAFIALFIMSGSLMFWAYIIAWIILAKRPTNWQPEFEYDEERHTYRERSVFRNAKPASDRLKTARNRMDHVSRRIENIEAYVTSNRYNLDREFEKMERGSS